LLQKVIR